MILEIENGPTIHPAGAKAVTDVLRGLEFPANKFAILWARPCFVQAMINEDGSFVVEYSEGSVDEMFEYEPIDLEEVINVFLLFLNGGDYRGALPFRRIP